MSTPSSSHKQRGHDNDDNNDARCTCKIPAAVNVTPLFVRNSDNTNTNYNHHQQQLVSNFYKYGWSPVTLNVDDLHPESEVLNSKCLKTISNYRNWKPIFSQSLFPNVNTNTKDIDIHQQHTLSRECKFIPNESGDPTNAAVESKVSWERQHCQKRVVHSSQTDHPTPVDIHMQSWIQALHQIAAVVVEHTFQVPTGSLITDSCSCCAQNNDDDSSSQSSGDCCSLDLLRAFYYSGSNSFTDEHNNDATIHKQSLGSSPHTDWGSFTVVWQDDVGGLQTHCSYCDTWVDVPPSRTCSSFPTLESENDGDELGGRSGSNILELIIHVGDLTSLAIGQALLTTTKNIKSLSNSNLPLAFPSPKHRVVSPSNADTKRCSLVYFMYPPPSATISKLSDVFIRDQFWQKFNAHALVECLPPPLSSYYLLKNQACGADSVVASIDLESMKTQPIDNVLRDKWLQVQRG